MTRKRLRLYQLSLSLTGVAVAGLLYRPRTRLFETIGWASIALFVLYVLNSYVMFLAGK